MINLKNVSFFYDENNLLFENFHLSLEDKKKYWLKGNNGTGKTTLLKILLNILQIKKGEISLKYDKKKTLFIPSTPFYEPYMSLKDFLTFYLKKMLKLSVSQIEVDTLLETLDLVPHKDTLCKDLSKGTIQKILIAPLFITNKWEYLFMDEPFEHLDLNTCELLKNKIIKNNSFILIINHKEHLLNDINDLRRIYL